MAQKDAAVVAITGGIGCGQSSVAGFMEKLGAKVINADLTARQIVNRDPQVRSEIKKLFGKRVYFRNGRLNRKLLGQIVFEDEAKTQQLNKIVHPRMVERVIEEIEKARDTGKYDAIIIDAALIYELNLEHMFDAVIVVVSRMGNRINRIKERDAMSEKEIKDRISKQIPVEDKAKWGEYVIHNNSTLDRLEQKSRAVYRKITKRSQRTSRQNTGRGNRRRQK